MITHSLFTLHESLVEDMAACQLLVLPAFGSSLRSFSRIHPDQYNFSLIH